MNLKSFNILVVDDDRDVLTAVRLLLKNEVGRVDTESNPENLRKLISENRYDLVLLDMNFNASINSGNEGLYWLRKIRELSESISIILITAYGDINLAIRSMKEGADDFLVKPWSNDLLISTISEVLKNKQDRGKSARGGEGGKLSGMIGESDPFRDLMKKIGKIAPTDANILVLGENGTGKDLVAREIWQSSLRKDKPFIRVDMGSLTETLFESELFGHKKGAFTDAREDRKGLIESADGGTVFFDEIGNITLQQQAKLLTLLQNREFTPLGSNRPVKVDIRLICATNLAISDLADEKRFRRDLIYRINTVEIDIPPLRQRGEDILLLADHFLRMYAKKYSKPSLSISKTASDKLRSYSFPGNVRELQYVMERAVIMSETNLIGGEDIIFSPIENFISGDHLDNTNLSELEESTIKRVLNKHNRNISRAANELGITRASLYRKMEKYNIK